MTRVRSGDGSMMQDRRGRGGGGLGGLGGLIPGGGAAMGAGGGILGIIVLLASLFLPKILGGSESSTFGSTSGQAEQSADGPCSDELEQVVCGATLDVQTYWESALPKFFNQQYRMTETVLFAGGTDTGCGSATSQSGPFYCPADGYVYIDLDFMQQLENQLVGTTSDLAEQYIIAHEYGHHVQNVLGINQQVRQAQERRPDRANQYSVALELQADCFAGAWVADVNARGLLESPDEVREALDAAAGVGDDRIQGGHADPDTFTHGTSEQRQTWFLRGFESGDPRRCDTFSEVL